MDINTMIKEARLRIVIGIKNPICTGFATQPITSALNVPFTVRIQDAGGGELKLFAGAVEYKNRMYVTYGTTMSKGREELLAVHTLSTKMPCIIASYNGRYLSFFWSKPSLDPEDFCRFG
jgi:hypothetical protein